MAYTVKLPRFRVKETKMSLFRATKNLSSALPTLRHR